MNFSENAFYTRWTIKSNGLSKKVSPTKYFFKSTIFPKTLLYQWEYFINTSLQHEPYFFSCVAGEV
jgi:hypothetical protein